ncbi:MAG: efflux RND transporter permease subunit [Hydrococcus sp. RU_2_2]|nr:efflux RND transporter permease subunit [Hydrococcus sp. RU_2_2]NJP21246.1 efflux RND transporter permease subunit [Hydrococcus sp. CRU_1_1]
MFNFFYRNRPLLILSIFLILVWGLSSFVSLPRMEDPQARERLAFVTTHFRGATPERVEALISEPIEQELQEIEEVEWVESSSRTGLSTIFVSLYDWVKEVDPVWSRVRDRLTDVTGQLPPRASQPELHEIDVPANALIVALTWTLDPPANYAILRRWSEELEDRLRALNGTEKVELYGAPDEEIVVEINAKELAGSGLTAQEVVEQISASDAKVSAGQLRGEQNDLLLEVEGELNSLERIRRIPIRVSETGQFTWLSDIARVEKGIAMPATQLAWASGKSAIALGAIVNSTQRLDLWRKAAEEALTQFRKDLPKGIGVQILLDQNRYVEARIGTVIRELIIGSLLAMSTVFLLMGWRAALVVGITLPLSALMVFGEMNVLGIPLHQISVVGMIIALGLLIDNAIVMADEVQVRLQKGIAPADAIAQSCHRMFVPLFSSTLTTAIAFLPIALAGGNIGEFINTIGITAILGLFSSLFISLTILPALAGKLHDWQPIKGASSWWQTGFFHPRLGQIYRRTLEISFGKPMLAIGLALFLPVIGFAVFPHLDEQFFPPTGRDRFTIDVELLSQTSIQETEATVLKARDLILKQPGVEDVHWFVGSNAPKIYYNSNVGRESPNFAQGIVQLRPGIESNQAIQNLQQKLSATFGQALVLVRQVEQGPAFNAPVEMRLYGSDLAQLQTLGDRLREELAQVPSVIQTRATLSEALPKLALSLDEEQVRLTGLDKSAIAQQLDRALEGTVGGSVLEGTEEIPVRVRLSQSDRADLDLVRSLSLRPNSSSEASQPIPLSALGNLNLVPEEAVIVRRDGQRIDTIEGFIKAGVLPSVVLKDFQARLAASGFTLPPGYRLEIGGEAEERNYAVTNLVSTVGVLGVLMVATLVLTFNSFILAGLIIVVALLSSGLGFLALWVSGNPFGFIAVLGTIGLIGIAVNESTVTLAAILEDPLARTGDRKATGEVVIHATRHMITTTVTDVAGFAPLLFDSTKFWTPLAMVIAGGLGGTTILALYFLPAVYLLLKRMSGSQLR